LFNADPRVASTLTNPHQLYHQLGEFWQQYLTDAEVLMTEQWGKLQAHADVALRAGELLTNQAISSLSPFISSQWRVIRLLESELQEAPNVVRFGSGYDFGDGTLYGQMDRTRFTWAIPETIQAIGLLVDHPTITKVVYDSATCVLVLADHTLRFTRNPFLDVGATPVYDASGAFIDRQILLWARNVQVDEQKPWYDFGAVLGMPGQSSAAYVEALRSTWTTRVGGPAAQTVFAGLIRAIGLEPCHGDETVEVVAVDDEGLAIVTDQRVYRFHRDANPLVAVGNRLKPLQALADTVQVIEAGLSGTPDYSALPGIVVDERLLATTSPLTFPNIDTVYIWHAASADVRIPIIGEPSAVETFWINAHLAGLASGQTLAQRLGITGPADVVAVNPMLFLIDHLFGANLVVVSLRPEHFLHVEKGYLTQLARLVPAGTILLIQSALQTAVDMLNLGTSDTADSVTVMDAIGVPLEVMDVVGAGLTYTDYAPTVTVN
jgi:hypothetical protein